MHNSNIERNGEIIDAIDDVLSYYKEKNLFERYYFILEYLAIVHIFLLASVRVIKLDRKHPLLKQFRLYIETQFPHYKKNPLLSRISAGRYFILSKLLKKKYEK